MDLASVEYSSNDGKGGRMKMEEQAMQELEMLESQYPNHFEYLKLELKSLIFQLQSHQLPQNTTFHSSIANTQESTSSNQRKRKSIGMDGGSDSCEHYSGRKKNKRRDRVDVVLERAEACLEKIRRLKTSLLSNT